MFSTTAQFSNNNTSNSKDISYLMGKDKGRQYTVIIWKVQERTMYLWNKYALNFLSLNERK